MCNLLGRTQLYSRWNEKHVLLNYYVQRDRDDDIYEFYPLSKSQDINTQDKVDEKNFLPSGYYPFESEVNVAFPFLT